jgi:hypothetical protein
MYINKVNNHLLPQIIEHQKRAGNPGPGSGLAKKCGGIKWLSVIGYQPSLS